MIYKPLDSSSPEQIVHFFYGLRSRHQFQGLESLLMLAGNLRYQREQESPWNHKDPYETNWTLKQQTKLNVGKHKHIYLSGESNLSFKYKCALSASMLLSKTTAF